MSEVQFLPAQECGRLAGREKPFGRFFMKGRCIMRRVLLDFSQGLPATAPGAGALNRQRQRHLMTAQPICMAH